MLRQRQTSTTAADSDVLFAYDTDHHFALLVLRLYGAGIARNTLDKFLYPTR